MVHHKHLLGDSLVHSHCTAKISCSCIPDSHQVKSGLKSAIFSIGAMQSQKNNVCHFTELQDIFPKKASAFFFHSFYFIIKPGHICRGSVHIIFLRERILPVYILHSTKNICKNCLMSFLAQSLTNTSSGYNGNGTFCTCSSSQYNNLHFIPPYNTCRYYNTITPK